MTQAFLDDGHTKYTVLGASGFVGRRIVQMLKSSELDCYAPTKGDEEIFERELGRVFYCIGLTADHAKKPFDTVEAHVSYLARVLQNATFDRLVYLSSTRLYDLSHATLISESDGLLLSPGSPRHIYDISKAMGESLCLNTSNGRGSVARLSCVYDKEKGSSGFLSNLLNKLQLEKSFVLDSKSGFSRDYIFLDDVVASLKQIIDSGRNEIFNVASGQNVSNQQLVETLNSLGCDIKLRHNSSLQMTPVCNISKINDLGIYPITVAEYLESVLDRRIC